MERLINLRNEVGEDEAIQKVRQKGQMAVRVGSAL